MKTHVVPEVSVARTRQHRRAPLRQKEPCLQWGLGSEPWRLSLKPCSWQFPEVMPQSQNESTSVRLIRFRTIP